PWLAPTCTSEPGRPPVTPASAHPLQAYWGMPRRIRLDFLANAEGLACDLTGTVDSVLVAGWRQRPRGPEYEVWGPARHPLSPFYRQKSTEPWLAVHPQPGGIGYRHWLGCVLADPSGDRVPARCVVNFRDRAVNLDNGTGRFDRPARLLAAGYDMDKMKARAF